MRRVAGRASRVARRARRSLRTRWRPRALAAYYAGQRLLPRRRKLAVFAAYWYRGYSCNPRAIYEETLRRCPGLDGLWVVGRRYASSFPADVPHVVAGTAAYYRAIGRATYLVNNVNFPDHLVKRRGSVHVMTHHGTPLKKMGLDLRGPDRTTDFTALLRRCGRWDFSVSANPHSTQVWERAFPGRYASLDVGYPRNDRLARATPEAVRRAREELGLTDRQRAILYAPTHREYDPSFTTSLDLAAFVDGLAGLQPEARVLARAHYFVAAGAGLEATGRPGALVDVSTHPSVETLCLAADVLLTDYSSLMFDYAVLDRPIVVYAPDWETYVERRGTYFDLLASPPGFVARTVEQLLDGFRSGALESAAASAAREAFRARFCPYDDGYAAQRVVTRVFGDLALTPTGHDEQRGVHA